MIVQLLEYYANIVLRSIRPHEVFICFSCIKPFVGTAHIIDAGLVTGLLGKFAGRYGTNTRGARKYHGQICGRFGKSKRLFEVFVVHLPRIVRGHHELDR